MKTYLDRSPASVSVMSLRQNRDTKVGARMTETCLCRMCGRTFERKDAVLFAGYELSPCCRSDNFERATRTTANSSVRPSRRAKWKKRASK